MKPITNLVSKTRGVGSFTTHLGGGVTISRPLVYDLVEIVGYITYERALSMTTLAYGRKISENLTQCLAK